MYYQLSNLLLKGREGNQTSMYYQAYSRHSIVFLSFGNSRNNPNDENLKEVTAIQKENNNMKENSYFSSENMMNVMSLKTIEKPLNHITVHQTAPTQESIQAHSTIYSELCKTYHSPNSLHFKLQHNN